MCALLCNALTMLAKSSDPFPQCVYACVCVYVCVCVCVWLTFAVSNPHWQNFRVCEYSCARIKDRSHWARTVAAAAWDSFPSLLTTLFCIWKPPLCAPLVRVYLLCLYLLVLYWIVHDDIMSIFDVGDPHWQNFSILVWHGLSVSLWCVWLYNSCVSIKNTKVHVASARAVVQAVVGRRRSQNNSNEWSKEESTWCRDKTQTGKKCYMNFVLNKIINVKLCGGLLSFSSRAFPPLVGSIPRPVIKLGICHSRKKERKSRVHPNPSGGPAFRSGASLLGSQEDLLEQISTRMQTNPQTLQAVFTHWRIRRCKQAGNGPGQYLGPKWFIWFAPPKKERKKATPQHGFPLCGYQSTSLFP